MKGLPWRVEEYELTDYFKDCGAATQVELPLGADGRSSGTAYIFFKTKAECDKCLELDGQIWPGTER